MSVASSAAGQNHRVGRRTRAKCWRGDKYLCEIVEAGWQYFWHRRRMAPPPVLKMQILAPGSWSQ